MCDTVKFTICSPEKQAWKSPCQMPECENEIKSLIFLINSTEIKKRWPSSQGKSDVPYPDSAEQWD